MGKNQQLELPAPPTYQTDPIFKSGYESLSKYANNLIAGDYSGFGGLKDATSLHPENTQLALQAANGFLQPQYKQANLDIQNQAIANNQNTSSTFTDALAKNAFNLNSQLQGIGSQAALQDAQQARQNQLSLFGQGLQTLQGATGFGLQNQNSQNQFNLENYDNLVAKAIQDNQNANKANGWQQALGLISPIGHDYLQSQGINSVPGYSVGDTLGFASQIFGMGGLGGQTQGLGQMQLGAPYQGWNISQPQQNALRFNSAPFAGAYASN